MKDDILFEITYPDEDEMKAAQRICCGRVCNECETPVAYAWRKREVDLSLLLEYAIRNELTETEQKIVEDRWYNSLTFSQIAQNRGVSVAAVRKTSERAIEKLERVLKYVVFYQRDLMNESVVPASVGRARVILSAKNMTSGDTGTRIRYLRLSKGFSAETVALSTGISKKRLCEIESGRNPDAEEIFLLSEFFDVTEGYILKGEKDG